MTVASVEQTPFIILYTFPTLPSTPGYKQYMYMGRLVRQVL